MSQINKGKEETWIKQQKQKRVPPLQLVRLKSKQPSKIKTV